MIVEWFGEGNISWNKYWREELVKWGTAMLMTKLTTYLHAGNAILVAGGEQQLQRIANLSKLCEEKG